MRPSSDSSPVDGARHDPTPGTVLVRKTRVHRRLQGVNRSNRRSNPASRCRDGTRGRFVEFRSTSRCTPPVSTRSTPIAETTDDRIGYPMNSGSRTALDAGSTDRSDDCPAGVRRSAGRAVLTSVFTDRCSGRRPDRNRIERGSTPDLRAYSRFRLVYSPFGGRL